MKGGRQGTKIQKFIEQLRLTKSEQENNPAHSASVILKLREVVVISGKINRIYGKIFAKN